MTVKPQFGHNLSVHRDTLSERQLNTSVRKLVAIMFTDIVGFTSLMGDDEQKAFEIIQSNLDIHKECIEKFHGKIVKELGDGLLSIFENGTEAVQCAVCIQQKATESNIPLRIGIHEGEVVHKNNDVFGDGVNITSRIQDEAAQGGICISDSVYRIIKNKTDIKCESIGSRHLKNVNEDIKLYQVKARGVKSLNVYTGLKRSRIFNWSAAVIIAILLIAIGGFLTDQFKPGSSTLVEKYDIILPATAPVVCKEEGVLPVAISPDGTTLVYQAFSNNTMLICKRYIDQDEIIPISGTEGGRRPFFSPDGKWIAYYSGGFLKKVLLTGGDPIDIYPVAGCTEGTWLPDNTIIIGIVGKGLIRVSAEGADYLELTSIAVERGEWAHNAPFCLPDGKTILYSARNGGGDPLYVKSINLENHSEQMIMKEANYPIVMKSGYLVFTKNNHLMAAPFNVRKLTLGEPSVVLIENIVYNNPSISLSDNGTLAYVSDQAIRDELVWVDMNGNIEPIVRDNITFWGPRLSPDGKKIAFWKTDPSGSHVFVYDLFRESTDKLTNSGENFWPVWTPDGKKIAYPALKGENFVSMYWKAVDKSTSAEPLLHFETTEELEDIIYQPQMWTSDGKFLLFVKGTGLDGNWDILMMDRQNNNQFSEFIATEARERHPRLSPDNKWVAYQSDESGKYEIYVTRFPEKGPRWQISSNGGVDPLWSPDGNKIYYRNMEDVLSVEIYNIEKFRTGKPEVLFSGKFRQATVVGWYYDIHPDGDKFVMVKGGEIDTTQNDINIIKNFDQEIERKFAAAR